MMNFRMVNVLSACCVYCDETVTYIVTDEQMPAFTQIDDSGDHSPVCPSCDFYRQQDLLAAYRFSVESQPGQPAQI